MKRTIVNVFVNDKGISCVLANDGSLWALYTTPYFKPEQSVRDGGVVEGCGWLRMPDLPEQP